MNRGLRVLLSAMIAGVPDQGGIAWIALQYALGLRRLGHEVLLLEPVDRGNLRPPRTSLAASDNATYFGAVVQRFGLADNAVLLFSGSRETVGLPYNRVQDWARRADLLINIGGSLVDPDFYESIPVRLYLDLDPGFTQLWQASEGIDMRFGGHTHFATVGLTLGQPRSSIPKCDIDWIPTLQPVVLEEWPYANGIERHALTTIANWRGYGSIEANGIYYGQKAHSLRRFFDLPLRSEARFDLALAIHPDETQDLSALVENGWNLLDPRAVAGTPEQYRDFIRGSRGEFGIAKSGYVEASCGWFSDRSACYLASGRPVIAQDTGFGSALPTGEGLFAFRTAEDVEEAVDALARDYDTQRRAARAIAEECFDSDVVLSSLLTRMGLAV